jgi:hypothetical protein
MGVGGASASAVLALILLTKSYPPSSAVVMRMSMERAGLMVATI